MTIKIGYFVPEFPGQTHIFFWREREILSQLEVETDIISTRKPVAAIASHVWTESAQRQTTYLVPFTTKDWFGALNEILNAGFSAWWGCLSIVAKAKDMSFMQRLRLLTLVVVAAKLGWLAKNRGWSHIHVHSCANAANIALFASIISKLSYSLTLHGPTLELYGPNQEQKWQYASFAIIVSKKLYHYVQNKLAGHLPKYIVVAPMGINLDKIKRQSTYIPWEATEPVKIFACGRLNPIKGHVNLVDTIHLLRRQGFDARLEIAGEDEQGGSGYHQELEKTIQDKSLSPYIKLLGAVDEERVRKGLEDAHIFALASLNEGVPVAVMEAMAMEMPVVVTDVGGTSELVDDEIDGLLVPPEKPATMAEAIAKVLQDKKLALRLSEKSRQKVMQKFSHRRSAELLAEYIQKIH